MGKYMLRRNWKSKTSREMEVPSLGGVLTRAKTLALQKTAAAGSYIQLRCRRLVKPISSKETCVPNKLHSSVDSVSVKSLAHKEEEIDVNLVVGDEEGSFGEKTLEIEGRGRTTRETTPCSLIRDPDTIKTPGSSTKLTTKSTRPTETKYRVLNTTPKPIPSASEVEEFFMGPEKQQQRLFIEKYNFDPVNDKPLHGRYEWVKVDATKKS
ncbi:hypothetical protein L1987_10610 [Smallanthus sonchifolius]|uniref:Uncharacterized protein n=1 Tax=Smallanthus sonchifolius TaxID=185202 RepID=A0ACB9JSR2_9ASTR|nr:hypothetical protein L1987_10610 [Smallanthus sonchifolius]